MTSFNLPLLVCCVLACDTAAPANAANASPIAARYDKALEAAAILETSLADPSENALLIGNGDINGLLFAGGAGLQLRLTKNDVWDARMNTANDPPMPTIDVRNHKVTGVGGDPASWGMSYPCPLACAVLHLVSAGAGPAWQRVRGTAEDTFVYANKLAVMSVLGKAGDSCGWQTAVNATAGCNRIRLRLCGTANARYYVTVNGAIESGWKDTPTSERDVFIDLPAGTIVSSLILYAWTKDGAPAENRYSAIELQGPAGNHAIDLQLVTPPPNDYRLDVKRAVAIVPGKSRSSPVTVRALADRNVFLVEGDTTVTLQGATAGFIPKAERITRDEVECLMQTLPADPGYPSTGDWPGMSFVVAKATAGSRTAVAIVTSLESKNPQDDAVALVRSTLASDADALRRKHERIWNEFWSASQIDLADTYFRDVWYRNLYFMRCVSKAGVKPVGLFAGLMGDSAAWHGDFHLNYNAQQTYWGWYACNHAELSQPYEWLISRALIRAKWFAKATYGCDGAFFPYNVFMHEPIDPAVSRAKNHRQMTFIPYTYTLGVAGWAVQNHWLHYKYYPSRELLQKDVYPALKEVAQFYADFVDQCKTNPATGKVVLGPSYCPELGHLGDDNGACDIAFIRTTFRAVIESADALGVDASLAARLKNTLTKLPDYPRSDYHRSGGPSPVVVGMAGFGPQTQYNVPVPALPVYPAGDVTWFSLEADRQLFSRTISRMSSNGNNDVMILGGARARLSLPDTYGWTRSQFLSRQRANGTLSLAPRGGGFNGYGLYSEDFAAAGVITEMLLQSVHGIIRIFPAWPADRDAAFVNLRAEGGFLVSAELKSGKIVKLEVTSTVGRKLRLLNPWSNRITERETIRGETVSITENEP